MLRFAAPLVGVVPSRIDVLLPVLRVEFTWLAFPTAVPPLNAFTPRVAEAQWLQQYIGAQAQYLESLVEDPNYTVNTLSLPYGQRPSNDALQQYLAKGSHNGVEYENIAVLNVGWHPAPSPFDEKFNPLSIPRIRASEMDVDNVGMYNYIEYFDNHPEARFISDGDPETITMD